MLDVAVIDDPTAAEVTLDPVRARLLAALAEPASASTLAAREGLSRQRVNYHLRALERHGLLELVEERRRGNCTERVMQATAASYVISPAALSPLQPDPARAPDQLSAAWMLAVGARLVRELGELMAERCGPASRSPRLRSTARSRSRRRPTGRRLPTIWPVPSRRWPPGTTRRAPATGAVIGWWWPCTPA